MNILGIGIILLVYTLVILLFITNANKVAVYINNTFNKKSKKRITQCDVLIYSGSWLIAMTVFSQYFNSSGSGGWGTTTFDICSVLYGIFMLAFGYIKKRQ